MGKLITGWATVKIVMEIPDELEEEEALDEFLYNTACTFEETENVGIVDVELVEVTDESPYEEDLEEDLDDEFYRKGYIEDNRLEEIKKNISE